MNREVIFHQLFEAESSTYTYLLADNQSKEAIIIDPVLETVDRDLKLISELGLKLKYILDTHVHADHITGAGLLREKTGAQTGVSEKAQVKCIDLPLKDGQVLYFGQQKIKAIATPGHTNTCMSFLCGERLFTGDSLLVRGCGRTDFQQGSNENMFHSIREILFKLPSETIVFPGHDYRGFTRSSIKEEKEFNPRLNEKVSFEDFKKTMSELKLAHPKKIHLALPANLTCGIKSEEASEARVFHPQKVDGIPEISCEDLNSTLLKDKDLLGKVKLIDVRRAEEYTGEYGHIAGAKLYTLGEELENYLKSENKEAEIVFICRSGGRSGNATRMAQSLGFTKTINMTGGMIRWTQLGYKAEEKNNV